MTKLTRDLMDEIEETFDCNPNMTVRELANMFRLPVKTVKDILLKKI